MRFSSVRSFNRTFICPSYSHSRSLLVCSPALKSSDFVHLPLLSTRKQHQLQGPLPSTFSCELGHFLILIKFRYRGGLTLILLLFEVILNLKQFEILDYWTISSLTYLVWNIYCLNKVIWPTCVRPSNRNVMGRRKSRIHDGRCTTLVVQPPLSWVLEDFIYLLVCQRDGS